MSDGRLRAALVGGSIVVDAEVGGRFLAVALRQARAAAVRNGVSFDPALVELLRVAEEAERAIADRAHNRPQPTSVAPFAAAGGAIEGSTAGEQVALLGAKDVARRFGCHEQSVRRAATRGTLTGRRDERGQWEFTEDAVLRWRRRCGASVDGQAPQGGRAGGGDAVAGRAEAA